MKPTAQFGIFVAIFVIRLTKAQMLQKDKYDVLKTLDAQVFKETLEKAVELRANTERFSLGLQRFVDDKRTEYFELVTNGSRAVVQELEELSNAQVETPGTNKDCAGFVSRKLGALKLMLDAYFDDCVQLNLYDRIGLFYVRSDRMKLTTFGRRVANVSSVILDCISSGDMYGCIEGSIAYHKSRTSEIVDSFIEQREGDMVQSKNEFMRMYEQCMPNMVNLLETELASITKNANYCIKRFNSATIKNEDNHDKDLFDLYKERDFALSNTVVSNVENILEKLKSHPKDMKNQAEIERKNFIEVVDALIETMTLRVNDTAEKVKALQPHRLNVIDDCLLYFKDKVKGLKFVADSSFDEYEKIYYYRTRTLYTIPQHRLYPAIARKAYNASAVILDCASELDINSCIESVLLENETATMEVVNSYVATRLKRLSRLLLLFHEGMEFTIPNALRFFQRSVDNIKQKSIICIDEFNLVSGAA